MIIKELTKEERPAFLALWKAAFGDGPELYDAMENCYGEDLHSYVLIDEDTVVAALTQFVMGRLKPASAAPGQIPSIPSSAALGQTPSVPASVAPGQAPSVPASAPVYVSYAINTRSDARGRGYGSAITGFARDLACDRGGVSMLCPAEPGLIDFYKPLGYAPFCFVLERTGAIAQADVPAQAPAHKVEQISFREYNAAREALLSDRTHLVLSARSLNWIEHCGGSFYLLSGEPASDSSAVSVSGSVASSATNASTSSVFGSVAGIAVSSGADDSGTAFIDELIPAGTAAPTDIDALAASLAAHIGAASFTYRAPVTAAPDRPDPSGPPAPLGSATYVQAMAAFPGGFVSPEHAGTVSDSTASAEALPYFGFPFD